jgi:orotate phosphoribosyltransferase-like protein
METVPVPKLTVSFAVDVEVTYNSFSGKTAEEIAESLQDELHDLLFELDQVTGVYTSCTAIATDD